MVRKTAEKSLFDSSAQEELDNYEETQPTLDDGYGDRINIVVPIRKDLNQIILAKLEDDLKWNKAIVNNACVNDSPSWTGWVKRASMVIPSIEKKIAEIRAKMEEE